MAFSPVTDPAVRQDFPHHIAGAWSAPEGAARREVFDPATGAARWSVPEGSATDVDRAVRAASAAAPGWAATDPDERARLLRALAALLRDRMADLAALESAITGRPIREMQAQMSRIPEWLEYFAGIVLGLEGGSNQVKGGFLTWTRYRPHGVCALLTPWNHPILILVKKLSAALAAGNTVVVKPSELAPVTPLLLGSWAADAGLPPGVINVVAGGAEAGAALVAHPEVAHIDLTGGTATGRRVAAAAAERLVPCTLELGGKTPLIVYDSADLDEAVAGTLFAGFVAAGQTCVSGSRILVQRGIYDAFCRKLAVLVESLTQGDPADPATDIGPVISAASRDRCLGHIGKAKAEGARLIAGGAPRTLPPELAAGFFVPPTVFAEVTPEMALFREEVFGPVISLTPFDTEDEAVAITNDSDFGLIGTVWSRDISRALRVADRIEAGQVFVNVWNTMSVQTPFGGHKNSGYGREKGIEAIHHYSHLKTVTVKI